MFNFVGLKIKTLAYVHFIICTILSIFFFGFFLYVAATANQLFVLLIAFLCLILGPFLSYATALLIYGFGELVNNSVMIEENTNMKKREEEEYHPL